MANVLLPILPGTLPGGYCFTSWQQTLLDFANNMQAVLNGESFYNYGDTKPPPELQSYPWLYSPTMTWYKYIGVWVSPNPETDADVRRWRFGTEASVWSYDGGDGSNPATTTPGSYTGAMWEVDHDFDGQSPMGPGLVPGTTTAPVTLLVSTNAGEGQHALTADENGPHTHTTNIPRDGAAPDTLDSTAIATHVPTDTLPWVSDSSGLGTPHNTIHPVRGIWAIKRTARQFYLIP